MELQVMQFANAGVKQFDTLSESWKAAIGQIETEFYNSGIYQELVADFQTKLGSLSEEIQDLVQVVSREAIALTLKKFVNHYRKNTDKKNMSNSVEGEVQLSQPSVLEVGQETHLAKTEQAEVTAMTNQVSQSDPLVISPEWTVPSPDKPEVSQVNRFNRINKPMQAIASKLHPRSHKKQTIAELIAQEREAYLRQMGQELQRARQAKMISLDQLHKITRVPIHQLKALETGQIEKLPEDIYVRGFIRLVGNALGLDGARIAKALPKPDPTAGLLPCWCKPDLQPQGFHLRPLHLYVGYAALMAGAVGGLNYLSTMTMPEATSPNTSDNISPPSSTSFLQGSKRNFEQKRLDLAAGYQVSSPEVSGELSSSTL